MSGRQLKMENSQGQLNIPSNDLNPNLKKPTLTTENVVMKHSAM